MEKVLEDLLFLLPDLARGEVVVDAEYVNRRMEGIVKNEDLSKYIFVMILLLEKSLYFCQYSF